MEDIIIVNMNIFEILNLYNYIDYNIIKKLWLKKKLHLNRLMYMTIF